MTNLELSDAEEPSVVDEIILKTPELTDEQLQRQARLARLGRTATPVGKPKKQEWEPYSQSRNTKLGRHIGKSLGHLPK